MDEVHGAEAIHNVRQIFVHEEYGNHGPEYDADIGEMAVFRCFAW